MISRTAALVAAVAFLLSADRAWAGDCRNGPCHRDTGRGVVVHTPVQNDECTECHTGRADQHPLGRGEEFSLASRDIPSLCYGCHGNVESEISSASVVHEPLRSGNCLDCHQPHESSHDSLLVAKSYRDSSGNQPRRMPMDISNFALCWECHDKYVAVMPKTLEKTGFRNGSRNLHYVHLRGEEGYLCSACHRPHAASREKLLGRSMDWTDDLVGYERREGGGFCAPGCHRAKVYRRNAGNGEQGK